MGLVIVGSIAFDDVKTPFGEVKKALGGAAVYSSFASKNFSETKIVGVVGNDFGESNIALLKNNKIDITGLEVVEGKTFRWSGVYNDLNKAETLRTDLNVFADFSPKIPISYKDEEFLFLANIDPDLQLQVLNQMEKPRLTAMDTMNFWIDCKKQSLTEVIKKVDILFINEEEIKQFTGISNIYSSAEAVLKLGLKYVVIKRGEYGSLVIGDDFLFCLPVYPVKNVVDPTGAGDSFAGGFMGYISTKSIIDKEVIKDAIAVGTVTASFNIEDFSLNKLKIIGKNEILDRAKLLKKMVSFEGNWLC